MAKKVTPAAPVKSAEQLVFRHLLIGWGGLVVFILLGIFLEMLHGLKLDLYLDVRQETRRLMWILAHAHGTLFSLVHLGFAWSVRFASRWVASPGSGIRSASWMLTAGLIAMPLGFFLGGIWTYGGDPGIGILLVPIGAVLMLIACLRVLIELATIRSKSAASFLHPSDV
ncbi:MAG: hypothetical protein KDN22_04605 [Verrucomicrobiae bacterium]|nr:hypothetical protein [Verrucomicrobiae bacterium]